VQGAEGDADAEQGRLGDQRGGQERWDAEGKGGQGGDQRFGSRPFSTTRPGRRELGRGNGTDSRFAFVFNWTG